jgi:hypothetical protein
MVNTAPKIPKASSTQKIVLFSLPIVCLGGRPALYDAFSSWQVCPSVTQEAQFRLGPDALMPPEII